MTSGVSLEDSTVKEACFLRLQRGRPVTLTKDPRVSVAANNKAVLALGYTFTAGQVGSKLMPTVTMAKSSA